MKKIAPPTPLPNKFNQIKKLIPNSYGIFYTKTPDGTDYGCTFFWPENFKEFKEIMKGIILQITEQHAKKWYCEKKGGKWSEVKCECKNKSTF